MSDQHPAMPSDPQSRTIAMPRDTNPSGAIFGGWTLSQMDLAGGTFASRHSGGRVVTASIDAMRFLRPVEVGDEVSCFCTLDRVEDGTFAVAIETWTRGRDGTDPEQVTKGVFTYVAVDNDGRPRTPNKQG